MNQSDLDQLYRNKGDDEDQEFSGDFEEVYDDLEETTHECGSVPDEDRINEGLTICAETD